MKQYLTKLHFLFMSHDDAIGKRKKHIGLSWVSVSSCVQNGVYK